MIIELLFMGKESADLWEGPLATIIFDSFNFNT